MAGPPLLLAVLGLAAIFAPAPTLGKVIHVRMPEDSNSGICPGSTCNMRAAWMVADLNDTIMLDVNPIMSTSLGPLTSPPGWGTTNYNGTVTITGPKGGAVVQGGSRFIAIDSFPYMFAPSSGTPSLIVRLVLRNLELTGFRYTAIAGEYSVGMVVCIATSAQWCNENNDGEAKVPKEHPQKVARGAKGQVGVEGPGLLGYMDTVFGNWSLLRANAMLEIDNCIFRNNSYDSVSNDNSYGSVVATHHDSIGVTPIIISSTQLMNNTIFGVSSATGTAYGSSGSGADALMVSNCRFANNRDLTTSTGGLVSGLDGPTIGTTGPISISGSSFVGNTMGSTRGVVSASFDYPHHVYIYDTTMIDNVANEQSSNENAAAIIGAWIVLERVTLILPPSVPLTATSSANDQYMAECGIVASSGQAVQFKAFQMFNRNPIFTNIENGTITNTMVADCKQAAPWLPCHDGTRCSNALNTEGALVGYRCS